MNLFVSRFRATFLRGNPEHGADEEGLADKIKADGRAERIIFGGKIRRPQDPQATEKTEERSQDGRDSCDYFHVMPLFGERRRPALQCWPWNVLQPVCSTLSPALPCVNEIK
jgi:hypothetical protein